MQDTYTKITEYHGIENQIQHFNEEVKELNEALNEHNATKEHIEEEVADVLNFIEQFIIYYKLDRTNIKQTQIYKNNRTLYEMQNNIKKEDRKVKYGSNN